MAKTEPHYHEHRNRLRQHFFKSGLAEQCKDVLSVS